MQPGNEQPSTTATPRPRLIIEGHRALLRSLHEDTFVLDTCPPDVLNWLEENAYIEEVLDDNNEFHFFITDQGRNAVLGSVTGN